MSPMPLLPCFQHRNLLERRREQFKHNSTAQQLANLVKKTLNKPGKIEILVG
jgi:hypothetical protein